MRVRVQAGPDKVPADVVEYVPGRVIIIQMVRQVADTRSWLPVGQPLMFTWRANGRYVVTGAKRDTGSYVVEADVEGLANAG